MCQPCLQVVVVTLRLASASHFKVLRLFFFVMGKTLSCELSCTGTGLVTILLRCVGLYESLLRNDILLLVNALH